MDIEAFRVIVGEYRTRAGRTQRELSVGLSMHPNVLSQKLHGARGYPLTYPEVKAIVLTLAEWQALGTRNQAEELLQLAGLPPTVFSSLEWSSPPLGQLEREQPNRRAPSRAVQPAAPVVLTEESARRPRLPSPATLLVGRNQEEAQVAALLQGDARLVTLTGVGGTGKTRLAIEVAAQLTSEFPSGVHFVDFSAVRDPSILPSHLARALGVRKETDSSLFDTLADRLWDKRMLLVLDNLEQVLPATCIIGDLIALAPQVRVLATSRVPLRLYGEHEYRVPPLGLPDRQDLEGILESDAVRLFVQRARSVSHTFALSTTNASVIAEICRRLDGLPLAIELAAARMKRFPPEELLARLGNLLETLSGGPRNVAERQRTLRATLDWSYDLLEPGEQRLFERLGVFVGGATVDSIEAVHREGPVTQSHLESLIEHGLVEFNEDLAGEPRVRMLETMREYAKARLAERDEADAVHMLHANYYVVVAEEADHQLECDTAQAPWLQRLQDEYGNLREALTWSLAADDDKPDGRLDLAVRLCLALRKFWEVEGYLSEGRRWIELALAADARKLHRPSASRAKLLAAGGHLAVQHEDLACGGALLEASAQLFHELGDRAGTAYTYLWLAESLRFRQQNEKARAYLDEALGLFQALGNWVGEYEVHYQLSGIARQQEHNLTLAATHLEPALHLARSKGDRRRTASALKDLGAIARDQGEERQAEALLGEALSLYREIGADEGVGEVLHNLGETALVMGDYERAAALSGESIAIFRGIGYKLFIGLALTNLGYAERHLGNREGARAAYAESMQVFGDLGLSGAVSLGLAGMAGIAAQQGQAMRAARLWAAAAVLAQGPPAVPAHRAEYERDIVAPRAALGEEAFAAAWAEGAAMKEAEAVRYALEDVTL
ncbi:MAG: tetratricopeptide repeat protein [Chloroflexota bacterium]|nr:tetratricopeptide repeat protein [Chloroflexota bacterium]